MLFNGNQIPLENVKLKEKLYMFLEDKESNLDALQTIDLDGLNQQHPEEVALELKNILYNFCLMNM